MSRPVRGQLKCTITTNATLLQIPSNDGLSPVQQQQDTQGPSSDLLPQRSAFLHHPSTQQMEGEADGREDHESLSSPHCEVHKERSEPTVGHAMSQGPRECGEALTMWERVREQALEARRRRMASSGGHLGHTDGMLRVRGWGCSTSRLHAMSDVQLKTKFPHTKLYTLTTHRPHFFHTSPFIHQIYTRL